MSKRVCLHTVIAFLLCGILFVSSEDIGVNRKEVKFVPFSGLYKQALDTEEMCFPFGKGHTLFISGDGSCRVVDGTSGESRNFKSDALSQFSDPVPLKYLQSRYLIVLEPGERRVSTIDTLSKETTPVSSFQLPEEMELQCLQKKEFCIEKEELLFPKLLAPDTPELVALGDDPQLTRLKNKEISALIMISAINLQTGKCHRREFFHSMMMEKPEWDYVGFQIQTKSAVFYNSEKGEIAIQNESGKDEAFDVRTQFPGKEPGLETKIKIYVFENAILASIGETYVSIGNNGLSKTVRIPGLSGWMYGAWNLSEGVFTLVASPFSSSGLVINFNNLKTSLLPNLTNVFGPPIENTIYVLTKYGDYMKISEDSSWTCKSIFKSGSGSLRFSLLPSGDRLLQVADGGRKLRIFSQSDQKSITEMDFSENPVRNISSSASGASQFGVLLNDGTIQVFETDKLSKVREINFLQSDSSFCDFSRRALFDCLAFSDTHAIVGVDSVGSDRKVFKHCFASGETETIPTKFYSLDSLSVITYATPYSLKHLIPFAGDLPYREDKEMEVDYGFSGGKEWLGSVESEEEFDLLIISERDIVTDKEALYSFEIPRGSYSASSRRFFAYSKPNLFLMGKMEKEQAVAFVFNLETCKAQQLILPGKHNKTRDIVFPISKGRFLFSSELCSGYAILP